MAVRWDSARAVAAASRLSVRRSGSHNRSNHYRVRSRNSSHQRRRHRRYRRLLARGARTNRSTNSLVVWPVATEVAVTVQVAMAAVMAAEAAMAVAIGRIEVRNRRSLCPFDNRRRQSAHHRRRRSHHSRIVARPRRY